MIFLNLEQLLEIHSLVLAETEGGEGLRDLGRLESAIAAQTQSAFGDDVYPGVIDKASALARGIIADHPFVDGNKRTAMLAGLTLLRLNGMNAQFKLGEIEDYAVKIAVDHLDVKQIASWLDGHMSK